MSAQSTSTQPHPSPAVAETSVGYPTGLTTSPYSSPTVVSVHDVHAAPRTAVAEMQYWRRRKPLSPARDPDAPFAPSQCAAEPAAGNDNARHVQLLVDRAQLLDGRLCEVWAGEKERRRASERTGTPIHLLEFFELRRGLSGRAENGSSRS